MTNNSNVFLWGAGATLSLGIKGTVAQGKFLCDLVEEKEPNLEKRIKKALGEETITFWGKALKDLLLILGETEDSNNNLSNKEIYDYQLEAMRRNSPFDLKEEKLKQKILELRDLYDWQTLKAIIYICPGQGKEKEKTFKLNDLFNILDLHKQSGHGFRNRQTDEFITPKNIIGARNALKMLLQTIFYIDYQRCIENKTLEKDMYYHYKFAETIGKTAQNQGIKLAKEHALDSRKFYMGNFSFISFNYDPLALWFQILANRNINNSVNVPYIDSPAKKLQIYHDMGHFVAGCRVERRNNPETPWHPMNEVAAQRLNDSEHGANQAIRINKFLFPHGCLCWRECPNCGKLSSYYGDKWEYNSASLIPPPPLKSFVKDKQFIDRKDKEKNEWKNGAVDARSCVHCDTITYAHHTQTIMQSNLKEPPPPFIEEIQRDFRVATQNANHIIIMGYSFSPDDVIYRAFLSARINLKDEVKCSVVGLRDNHKNQWLKNNDLDEKIDTVKTTIDLFGKENVRYNGVGIPKVFLDKNENVTLESIERLLDWNKD